MALTEVSAFKNLSIVNDDINGSAAIAGTKISPDFGSQNITTTGSLTVNGMTTANDFKISDVSPSLEFEDTNADADNQRWDFKCSSNNTFAIQALTNAGGGGGSLFKINRNGNNITTFEAQKSGTTWFTVDNVNKKVTTEDLDVTNNITVTGTVDGVDIAARDTLFGALTSSSGVLTNGVTATTQSASDNSTKIATTAYVDNAVSSGGGGGGGISNLVEDTTPELGGDLTVDGHDIIIEHQDRLIFKRDGTTKLRIDTFNGNQRFSASSNGVEFNVAGSGTSAFKVKGLNGSVEYFSVNNSGVRFAIHPLPTVDDSFNLGSGAFRWDNVYATNAAIQSSDQNLKQDIQALTTAEKAVATTLKGLIKTFKYKKAVAAKGDKARIHCGVIAQEVKVAFEAQGLKAEDYALFCYDEWDAVAEEKDEDGNITQPAVPAGNRYSIRYTELLAFIISVL